MKNHIRVNDHVIGSGFPVYLVAELSANHGQNFEQAVKLVQGAREAGADAVKLQTYTPDTLTIKSDKEYFRIGGGTLWEDAHCKPLKRPPPGGQPKLNHC
jgi:sialic acid synthase SpsE